MDLHEVSRYEKTIRNLNGYIVCQDRKLFQGFCFTSAPNKLGLSNEYIGCTLPIGSPAVRKRMSHGEVKENEVC